MKLIQIFTFLLFTYQIVIGQTKKNISFEKKVDALIQPYIDSSKIAGMAVGVMRNDTILLLKSYGYADIEFDVKLPQNAIFEIGSMTKQFTAVSIFQLAEKGLIQLDDPIDKHIPILNNEKITVRHLLNHTSGISEPRLGNLIYQIYPRDTLITLVEKGKFDFKPGTAMIYNNTGYKLLGIIIEKVSGKTFEQYLKDNIFSKVGMQSTFFSDHETVRKNRTHGYNNLREDGKLTRAEQPYFYWTYSAGALSSTMADLLKWNKALHYSEQILDKTRYNEFIRVGVLNDSMPLRYANGLQVLEYKGHNVIGHGGSGSGILCDTRYFANEKLTIITLQNTYRRASESEFSYLIADNLLNSKIEGSVNFEGDLSMYKGDYKGILKMNIDVVDTKLVMRRNGQKVGDILNYLGNQKWALGNDQYIFKTENGQVKELHWDAISAYFRLKKIN